MAVADAVPLYLTIVMVILCVVALMGKADPDLVGEHVDDEAEQ